MPSATLWAMQTNLRYPVGVFEWKGGGEAARGTWLDTLEQTPARLRQAIAGLAPSQLDTPYREGGWTVRQVVHHLPDSHLNAYIRTRLALTENNPTIKPYDEAGWAQLADYALQPEVSVQLLEAVHLRWCVLWRSLTPQQWLQGFVHPQLGQQTLEQQLALYDWHSRHHLAHITALRQRMGW